MLTEKQIKYFSDVINQTDKYEYPTPQPAAYSYPEEVYIEITWLVKHFSVHAYIHPDSVGWLVLDEVANTLYDTEFNDSAVPYEIHAHLKNMGRNVHYPLPRHTAEEYVKLLEQQLQC